MTSENNEDDFLRQWSGRAFDHMQLASIEALHHVMIDYAMTAWRPMTIKPPANVLLLCAVEEGLALMTINAMGDWRSEKGQPHKPPRAWMPAPKPPKTG